MPHIIVEYSRNIEASQPMEGLLRAIHEAAIVSGVFETQAIRTRGEPRDAFLIADLKNPHAGFVHITARIRPGRSQETRQRLGEGLLKAAEEYFRGAAYAHPLALNVEIHELPPIRLGSRLNQAEQAG